MQTNEFINKYINDLKELLDLLDKRSIDQIISLLRESEKSKSRIFILGNGGSAATASHMANDFGPGLKRRGILNLDIYSLSDNAAVCTAIANDIGYDNIFYIQLKDILKKDDIVIAISCSGNSDNIIKAVNYAKEIGSKVVGITGFDGGKLKQLSDINFHVQTPKGSYGLVEDIHMILDHVIYSYFIYEGNNHE